ncbi:MAG: metalloregulator ArsR/SmtB family transcription factor [Methylotenera sp.]|uniref:ArsR/SmtB family transcription factor n=1 Tax=Methylotenera sp. TaxID=2051956 RepID=UPI00248A484B|nr:metalloregulator ArsR/SmtB family transcription factor [Methylotenera sp.]MDI1309635.1 metalloregulator ArsR/SmtB family transcription factor [Methylotenera sp.]
MEKLNDIALEHIAQYFQALSEPTRLKILHSLQDGERNVSELTELSGCTQANVSKHLSLLAKIGLVKRESRGTSVYYNIADPSIYTLCELVCGQIGSRLADEAPLRAMLLSSLDKFNT